MSDVKKVSRRIFEEVWNNKNVAAIDELMAANYVHHDPQSPKFSDGREGYKQLVEYYLKAFPDSHFTIDQEIQEDDTAVTRWTWSRDGECRRGAEFWGDCVPPRQSRQAQHDSAV